MDFELQIENVKPDFIALHEKDAVYPGDAVYVVTFAPVAIAHDEYMKLLGKTKDHTIKVKTEE